MAAGYDGEVKTHFFTKEGEYRLLQEAVFSRPSRVPFYTVPTVPVRLSFVTLNNSDGADDRVVFNVDKEVYFFTFCGADEVIDAVLSLVSRSVYLFHVVVLGVGGCTEPGG